MVGKCTEMTRVIQENDLKRVMNDLEGLHTVQQTTGSVRESERGWRRVSVCGSRNKQTY